MSAQLSRCVAVYSRHFVASRINARPRRRRRRRRVYVGPHRNNPENNGMDQIVTRPSERPLRGGRTPDENAARAGSLAVPAVSYKATESRRPYRRQM